MEAQNAKGPQAKQGEEPLPDQIGKFSVIKRIGRGGMGEVFLAKDPSCDRLVAIKKIRPDLSCHEIIRNRFLKEAKLTASLCHPSIIPVYSIHELDDDPYYVMPYVEGETLKSILKETIQREKRGDPPHPIGYSISALLKIFMSVCQAVSYCHSRGILHRDLKPENILVANYGQILIFDWGLASLIGSKDSPLPEGSPDDGDENLTRPGKVLGTLSYMPPERADGTPADERTDLYSLGVILYQILTLRMPFHRKSIKSFKRIRKHEALIDALEAAPYRDIPPKLAEIAKRCLAFDKGHRYSSTQELLWDLERYRAGLADWIFVQDLDVNQKGDWELQESVLLSKLVEITHSADLMDWYILMISKKAFSGNKKLEINITLKGGSHGIGFFLNMPEASERKGFEDGYLLWVGSKLNPGIRLYRSHVNVLDIHETFLEEDREYLIEIEKIDHHVRCHIDGDLVLNFQDTLPIVGTHVGLLCRDMEFSLSQFQVSVGSYNATVGCLSIPDALLASKNFSKAIEEYEAIAESFAGRREGKEAIFRKGVALIEQAKTTGEELERQSLLDQANLTFTRLHQTSYEPMEYLGKSLVYQKGEDLSEESKCLELGLRKLKKSPLIHLIEERVVFRLHESASGDRHAVHTFALLCLRFLTHRLSTRETHALVHGLMAFCELPSFFVQPSSLTSIGERYRYLAISLAFWTGKSHVIKEMLGDEKQEILQEIGQLSLAFYEANDSFVEEKRTARQILYHWEKRLYFKRDLSVLEEMDGFDPLQLSAKQRKYYHLIRIWALLLDKRWEEADQALGEIPGNYKEKTSSPFFMLYGCLLAAKEGFDKAMEHFRATPDYVYPPLYSLLASYLKRGETKKWTKGSFPWERIYQCCQLSLFYHCLGEEQRSDYYHNQCLSHRESLG